MTNFRTLIAAVLITAMMPLPVLAVCERNVDNVAIHYINGMFTDRAGFESNREAIDAFMVSYFANAPFQHETSGTHNFSEPLFEQALQVARHKFEDASASVQLAIKWLFNNDPEWAGDAQSIAAVQEYLADISDIYTATLGDADADAVDARAALVSLLDTCARVVLLTHSQGNFYGNAVFTDLYASYSFPTGYSLARYPMFGTMQVASPVYTPGGAAGTLYPQVVGHLTNDTDIPMTAVRGLFGAVFPNYPASFNPADFTGHGLEASYLTQPGQAQEIADNITRIVYSMEPFPLHGQYPATSTAIQGYGYSRLSQYLDIQFTGGAVYRYSDVLEGVFDGLHHASSKGTYFHESVRNDHAFERLE